MIEIDQTALPSLELVRPILASHLLLLEEKQRQRFSGRGQRIRTGCGEIDDYMLGGGCERGIVLGISAEGGESRLITFNFLSSILISNLPPLEDHSIRPAASAKIKATIIDTTGSFPISLLAKILKSRIQTSRSKVARQAVDAGNYVVGESNVSSENSGEDIQRCLEMVAISRVFDVEGLWEVLGEVGRDSDRVVLGDEERAVEDNDEEGMEIIVIDNMTHLISELFARKERGEAHTLLKTLSRALHTLTQTQNILTILHNTTVPSKPYTTHDPSNPYPNPYQATATTRKQPTQNPQPASIFASNPLKPALGQIFAQFPDLHVLMSKMPKTRRDAERLYERDGEDDGDDGGDGRNEGVGYCFVVEVLKDEAPKAAGGNEKEGRGEGFGGREQRWAAVEVGADGLGLVDAFMAKGNMRGLGLEREKGRVQDVGNVAKIYGFGGRRV